MCAHQPMGTEDVTQHSSCCTPSTGRKYLLYTRFCNYYNKLNRV